MKVALVLSGGGAKGAFQFGAEKYCRERGGYSWDVIAGVSVGALNGAMLAMESYDRLEDIWRTVRREDVYRGGLNLLTAIHLLFGARAIYDSRPLWAMIDREINPSRIVKELIVGAVSLRSGSYMRYKTAFAHERPDAFKRAVYASASLPLLFPPTAVNGEEDMVDGGLRNLSPLGDVIDYDPDEIVVINTEPTEKPIAARPANIIAVAERSLSIALDEIFEADLREFLRINDLVTQAEAKGITLRKPDGTPFRRYRSTIIEPDVTLGSVLDFSRTSLDRWLELGWQKAEEVLSHSFEEATASRD